MQQLTLMRSTVWLPLTVVFRQMYKVLETHDMQLLLQPSKPTTTLVVDSSTNLHVPTNSNHVVENAAAAAAGNDPVRNKKTNFPETTQQMIGWRVARKDLLPIDPFGSGVRPQSDIYKSLNWPPGAD